MLGAETLSLLRKRISQHQRVFIYLAALALIVFCLLLYRGIGSCGLENDEMTELEPFEKRTSLIRYAFSPWVDHFAPAWRLEMAILKMLFGMKAAGYYYVLLSALILTAFLLWKTMVMLGASHAAGFLAALMMCAHPATNDTVLWISGSFLLFQNLWGLLAIILMKRFLTNRRPTSYALALLCYILCLESNEFGGLYLAFMFLCLFPWARDWRHHAKDMLYYFLIPFCLLLLHVLCYLFVVGMKPSPHRFSQLSQYSLVARFVLVWVSDGLAHTFEIWPEFNHRYGLPSGATTDRSLAMLLLFLFCIFALSRRVTRVQVIGLLWTATGIAGTAFFGVSPRYLMLPLPGFLMFLSSLIAEDGRAVSGQLPRIPLVNLLIFLLIVAHFSQATEARKSFYIHCAQQQESLRDQILDQFAHVAPDSVVVMAYPRNAPQTIGRMSEYSVGHYLNRFAKPRGFSVVAEAINFPPTSNDLADLAKRFVQAPGKVYFCLWDGKTLRDVSSTIPKPPVSPDPGSAKSP